MNELMSETKIGTWVRMMSRKIAIFGIALAVIGILFLVSPAIAESSPLCTYQESYQLMCRIPPYFYTLEVLGIPVFGVGGLFFIFGVRKRGIA